MRVLVAFGTKMGGTEGIAEEIARRLAELGYDADVRPADDVEVIDPYSAIIIGGALYSNRWHKDARRFVRRHHRLLSEREVWFFSSGPLDETATEVTIPPTRQVDRLMEGVGARGHMTFGGKLDEDVRGFPASAMAKEMAGDYRDLDHIRQWVDVVAAELTTRHSVR